MDDDEAALLAELRAISSRSTSRRYEPEPEPEPVADDPYGTGEVDEGSDGVGAMRGRSSEGTPLTTVVSDEVVSGDGGGVEISIGGSGGGGGGGGDTDTTRRNAAAAEGAPSSPAAADAPAAAREETAATAVPPVTVAADDDDDDDRGGGGKRFQPAVSSTFSGERGGAAEDADLLAELRAISSKSASSSRFASSSPGEDGGEIGDGRYGGGNAAGEDAVAVGEPPVGNAPASGGGEAVDESSLPPWKRGRGKKKKKSKPASAAATADEKPWQKGRASQKDRPSEGAIADDCADVLVVAPKKVNACPPANSENRDGEQPASTSSADDRQSIEVIPEPAAAAAATKGTGGRGFRPAAPSTFSGERGGAAEDADLLAELRAVSSKSASSSRFASSSPDGEGSAIDTNPAGEGAVAVGEPPVGNAPPSGGAEPVDDSSLPPWKRGRAKKKSKPASAAATAGAKPWQKGRASQKDPPSEGAIADDCADVLVVAPKKVNACPPANSENRDGEQPASTSSADDRQSIEVIPEPAAAAATTKGTGGRGFRPAAPSTFSGERGGAAEDADLLAELRAVSSKSASSSRFASTSPDGEGSAIDTNDAGEGAVAVGEPPVGNAPPSGGGEPVDDSSLPPWKRGRAKKKSKPASAAATAGAKPWQKMRASQKDQPSEGALADDCGDVLVVAPKNLNACPPTNSENGDRARPASTSSADDGQSIEVVTAPATAATAEETRGRGFRPAVPSTFSGERGGAAEDADLLAELRAVSSKSASSSRFASPLPAEAGEGSGIEGGKEEESSGAAASTPATEEASKEELPKTADGAVVDIPPWKRNKPSAGGVKSKDDTAVPPWKRKGAGRPKARGPSMSTDDLVVEVAVPDQARQKALPGEEDAPPPFPPTEHPAVETTRDGGGGFKPSMPSTFSGERGGAAEDADLLAELRAISSKSTSSRFASPEGGDDDGDRQAASASGSEEPEREETATCAQSPSSSSRQGDNSAAATGSVPPWKQTRSAATAKNRGTGDDSVPPWKKKGTRKPKVEGTTLSPNDDVVVDVADPEESAKQTVPTHQAPPSQGERGGGGLEPPVQSTFSGERGGAAEDADLLAELRAVSSKSSSSSRFASSEGGGDVDVDTSAASSALAAPVGEELGRDATSSSKMEESSDAAADVPPWRRKTSKKTAAGDSVPPWKKKGPRKPHMTGKGKGMVEVAIPETAKAVPEQTSLSETPMEVGGGGGFTSSTPSTFSGERGGAAEDDDLLAELRAISSKSTSARFASTDDTDGDVEMDGDQRTNQTESSSPSQAGATLPPRKREKPAAKKDNGTLPPWKAKGKSKAKQTKPVDDVVTEMADPVKQKASGDETPPLQTEHRAESDGGGEASSGLKTSVPTTFVGERGGAAEDADLLAELRAISSKSSSSSRFASPDDGDCVDGGDKAVKDPGMDQQSPPSKSVAAPPQPCKVEKVAAKRENNGVVPPWKKRVGKPKPKQGNADDDVVVVAESTKSALEHGLSINSEQGEGNGFKSSVPSTFAGNRGGAAEDADLLAELRAISSKSTSSSRFATDGTDCDEVVSTKLPEVQSSNSGSAAPHRQGDKPTRKKRSNGALPPWKKNNNKVKEAKVDDDGVDVTVAESVTKKIDAAPQRVRRHGSGLKSSTPPAFAGERGGAAEDADLLAELRAISSKSTSGFSAGNDDSDGSQSGTAAVDIGAKSAVTNDAPPLQASKDTSAKGSSTKPSPQLESSPGASPAGDAPFDPGLAQPAGPTVTLEDLPASLSSKDWKIRKASYELLTSSLTQRVEKVNPSGEEGTCIDGDTILQSLDDLIPSMAKDSNAVALDAAIEFVNVYANNCIGATKSERAGKLTASLVNGTAFSSSRPSTVKKTKSLVMKLMEVGEDGPSSIHSVVEVLLEQGLRARKPKVVVTSVSFVVEAATSFGATFLPLAAVSSSIPKMLSHANSKVREAGMSVMAEICRAVGSKAPLQNVIDSLKSSQISQLDSLLEKQKAPSPPTMVLRSQKVAGGTSASPADALAALEQSAKELEAKRFASRPAVNIMHEATKTDYAAKLKLEKWSEKVGALDILLECGGEKPFKLAQPSATANYCELVSDLKRLLGHSHFAVNSKSMAVLNMLSEGVGEKLYPHLRPLLPVLLDLSKDKKLTNASGKCLDVFFGNVLSFEHLLDKEDAIPTALDERKQKNALARTSTLAFLKRCVERRETAGRRGSMSSVTAERVARLASKKLNDLDPGPRKVAAEILGCLASSDDDGVRSKVEPIIEEIKGSHPRVFKALSASSKSKQVPERKGSINAKKKEALSNSTNQPPVAKQQNAEASSTKTSMRRDSSAAPKSSAFTKSVMAAKKTVSPVSSPDDVESEEEGEIPSSEDAIEAIEALAIPNWGAPVDDGGILAGLKASAWKSRKSAIDSLNAFVSSTAEADGASSSMIPVASIVVLVKEHTKGFKESNVIVTKSIMELFVALFERLADLKEAPHLWICRDAVNVGVEKIADRKLSDLATSLLTSLCVVRVPRSVLVLATKAIAPVKSPLSHEVLLRWCVGISRDFGVAAFGNGIRNMSTWIVTECKSSNPKVRKAALSLAEEIHIQLGPVFKALILSCSDSSSPAIKGQLETCFDSATFDPNASKMIRPKSCVTVSTCGVSSVSGNSTSSLLDIEIPKVDLMANVSKDCLTRMGTKEGKNAWKIRKEAMEEVASELKKCSGLVSCTPSTLKELADLVRKLRERMNDSQSNLKPLAANILGDLLSSVDDTSQAKLGKIAFPSLVSAAMNDNKKNMREAALSALSKGMEKSAVDGGGLNRLALEGFVASFVVSVQESEYKAGGLADVLAFVTDRADALPKVGTTNNSKAQALEQQFAQQLVACLTSSKSETRHAASALLEKCTAAGTVSSASIEKGVGKLLPAQQRSVKPIIAQMQSVTKTEHDNSTSSPPAQSLKPSSTAHEPRSPGKKAPSLRRKASNDQHNSQSRTPVQAKVQGVSRDRSKRKDMSSPTDASVSPPETSHPLKGTSLSSVASTKDERSSSSSRKRDSWPEYPEEPTGREQLNQLKKAWSPLLPLSSINSLFPRTGISKQDDAIAGAELLLNAVSFCKEDATDWSVLDHLDLIFKWLSCCLCARENTTGMQTILSLIEGIFSLLKGRSYHISDFEASILLPHILDRGSTAKGRFRLAFGDIIRSICTDLQSQLYFPQKYGPLICVTVAEHSTHAKARVLAMNECRRCIEQVGLSGIGKRGILNSCRTVSEETLVDNRNAALDVIEAVIIKMNGDLQKFVKICGTNLSDKGKGLVEERWTKHKESLEGSSSVSGTRSETSSSTPGHNDRRKSNAHPKSISKRKLSSLPSLKATSPSNSPARSKGSPSTNVQEANEKMPRLSLQLGQSVAKASTKPSEVSGSVQKGDASNASPADGPFTFKYNLGENARSSEEEVPAADGGASHEPKVVMDGRYVLKKGEAQNSTASLALVDDAATDPSAAQAPASTGQQMSGAAASLRARLKNLRESNASDPNHPPPPPTNALLERYSVSSLTSSNGPSAPLLKTASEEEDLIRDMAYSDVCFAIDNLLSRRPPVSESDADLVSSVDAIQKLNSSITSRSGEIDRADIKMDASGCLMRLTRVLDFSLGCGEKSNHAGISVSLLSVTVAALMAFLRESSLAHSVSQESISVLLRQLIFWLLDSRLGSQGANSATAKLGKAMNRLAIQAAIGSVRHKSFQALMSLQVDYCSSALCSASREEGAPKIRMARITTKLFARTIRAEEEAVQPYSTATGFDRKAILCGVEDMLVAVDDVKMKHADKDSDGFDSMAPCTDLARTLMLALLKPRGTLDSGGAESIKDKMEKLGIDRDESCLGRLLSSIEAERIDFEPSTSKQEQPTQGSINDASSKENAASFNMSAVNTLTNAVPGPKTGHAVNIATARYSDDSESSNNAGSTARQMDMSERIRFLKSRLSATEAAVQSAVQGGQASGLLPRESTSVTNTREPQISGALVKTDTSSGVEHSTSSLTIRERLAAAQESRASSEATSASSNGKGPTAMGHAAALRARLEAMKKRSG